MQRAKYIAEVKTLKACKVNAFNLNIENKLARALLCFLFMILAFGTIDHNKSSFKVSWQLMCSEM